MNSLNDYNEAMIERERQIGKRPLSMVGARLNKRLNEKHEESAKRARYIVRSISLVCPACGGEQPWILDRASGLEYKEFVACSNCSELMSLPPIVGSIKQGIVTYP